ncbi:MAG: dTDP-4-dehydrorhamnose reductase [Nitrospiraceae bacterium]
MRILITGANGQLGHELARALHGHDLVPADLPTFDLLTPEAERHIRDARPELVIHAAAYTDVEGAEREPALAMAVNAEGTERVARAAASIGARLIAISTDYVFDGRKTTPYNEQDEPNPLGSYGRSKWEGERAALRMCPDTVIVRTAWLYGLHGKNFVKTIMRLAAEQSELRVVADQRGCPTHAGDLADALARLVLVPLRGVAHAVGSGDCTWHEFASEIVALMGRSVPVRPITTAATRSAVSRPAYTVLENRVLAGIGITLPHWKEALARFMRDVTAASPVLLR